MEEQIILGFQINLHYNKLNNALYIQLYKNMM